MHTLEELHDWVDGKHRYTLLILSKYCGIPRGLVVDGIYSRHPLVGGREHHWSPPYQSDGGDTWQEGAISLGDILKGDQGLTPGGARPGTDTLWDLAAAEVQRKDSRQGETRTTRAGEDR